MLCFNNLLKTAFVWAVTPCCSFIGVKASVSEECLTSPAAQNGQTRTNEQHSVCLACCYFMLLLPLLAD